MKINIHTHHFCKREIAVYNICVGIKKQYHKKNFFSVGIHPWHITQKNIDIFEQEFIFLSKLPNCLAIGEIGLDKLAKTDYNLQKFIFEKQVIYAQEKNLPVIIHCVKSFNDILVFRDKYHKTPWIIHDFSGSISLAKELIRKNIYLSVGNKLMNNSSKIEKILPFLQSEKFFLETDNKFFRIDDIYEKTARILKISEKNLEQIIYTNFKTLFNGITI